MLCVAQGSNYIQSPRTFAVFYPFNYFATQSARHSALFMPVYPTLITVIALLVRDLLKFF
jgi:hypothetical protein